MYFGWMWARTHHEAKSALVCDPRWSQGRSGHTDRVGYHNFGKTTSGKEIENFHIAQNDRLCAVGPTASGVNDDRIRGPRRGS